MAQAEKKGPGTVPSRNAVLQRKCSNCRTNDGDDKKMIVQRSAALEVPQRASSPAFEELKEPGHPPGSRTQIKEARFGYDFSGVRARGGGKAARPVHSMNIMAHERMSTGSLIGREPFTVPAGHNAVSRSIHVDGAPAIDSLNGLDEIFIDGNGEDNKTPAPAPKVTPPKEDPQKKEGSACPTDIKVMEVRTVSVDAKNAEDGTKTGFGGYAAMEVSGPGARTWDGTAIHENLKNLKNSCEVRGACSNANGNGGTSGSTFKVGEKANFLKMRSLSAKKNTFYDQHIMAMKDSWLHKSRKSTCEVQCEQKYDCNGTPFGPTFIITYSFSRDTVNSDLHSFYVTQIGIKKEASK